MASDDALYRSASQKAELAVKADSDGRLAEAMRYYEVFICLFILFFIAKTKPGVTFLSVD
jgi:hypothetical protein